jgi:hypothetical protein
LEIFRLSVDKNRRQKGTAAKLIDRINQVQHLSLHRKMKWNKLVFKFIGNVALFFYNLIG